MEIHALQGILAQVQTGNKRKRDDEGVDTENPAAVSAQLLNSWLTVSNDAGEEGSELPACFADPKKVQPSQEQVQYLQQKIATLNTVSEQDDLLNLLTKLEREMVVPVSNPRALAGKPQTKTDKFRDKLLAARKLREKKKLEAQIRQNLRHNLLNRPRADQIPITYLNPKPRSSNLAYLGQPPRSHNPGRPMRKPVVPVAAPSRAGQFKQTKAQVSDVSRVASYSSQVVHQAKPGAPSRREQPSSNQRLPVVTAPIPQEAGTRPTQSAPAVQAQTVVSGFQAPTPISHVKPQQPPPSHKVIVTEVQSNESTDVEMDEDALFLQAMAAAAAKYDKPLSTDRPTSQKLGYLEDFLSDCSGSCSTDLFARFKVEEVTATKGSGYFPVLNVKLTKVPGSEAIDAVLSDEWGETPLCKGDFINIVWSSPKEAMQRPIRVTAQRNLLILCPDLLVSPTRITGAVKCTRRSVLAEQVVRVSIDRPNYFIRLIGCISKTIPRQSIPRSVTLSTNWLNAP